MVDQQEPGIDLTYNRFGTAYILFGLTLKWRGRGRGRGEWEQGVGVNFVGNRKSNNKLVGAEVGSLFLDC